MSIACKISPHRPLQDAFKSHIFSFFKSLCTAGTKFDRKHNYMLQIKKKVVSQQVQQSKNIFFCSHDTACEASESERDICIPVASCSRHYLMFLRASAAATCIPITPFHPSSSSALVIPTVSSVALVGGRRSGVSAQPCPTPDAGGHVTAAGD